MNPPAPPKGLAGFGIPAPACFIICCIAAFIAASLIAPIARCVPAHKTTPNPTHITAGTSLNKSSPPPPALLSSTLATTFFSLLLAAIHLLLARLLVLVRRLDEEEDNEDDEDNDDNDDACTWTRRPLVLATRALFRTRSAFAMIVFSSLFLLF